MKKSELIAALEGGREKFLDLFSDCDDQQMLIPDADSGWSIKDILAHLTRWEAELVRLLWQVRQGQPPTTLHFSDVSVDEINAHWLGEDRSRSLEQVLQDFHGVRNQTIRRLESFIDNELFNLQQYSWLKGKALWEVIAGDSYEHEAEHAAQIQAILSANPPSVGEVN